MLYTVTYTETLSRTYIVEADSCSEASRMMSDAVDNENIVLDYSDYIDCDIYVENTSTCDVDYYPRLEDLI